MKKFVLLPIILAVGIGIIVFINGEKGGTSEYITTASGLKYKDLKVGNGKEAKPHDTVTVNYTGTLKDGTKFDSSYDHPEGPSTFSLDEVVKGWGEGIPGMKVGGKRQLIIPPALGYGAQAKPKIPPNSELIFEVELLDVK